MIKRYTSQQYIELASQKHNNKYDYSTTEYSGCGIKVSIICKSHGIFYQMPNAHLFGRGCSKCGGKLKLTTEEFIRRANSKHGDGTYDYSKSVYTSINNKIKIICKTHGEFELNAKEHLKGSKCGICNGVKINTQEFIRRSQLIHGMKYDYSSVLYKNNIIKVLINCKSHGNFLQSPAEHLLGKGCKLCGNESTKLTKDIFVSKSKEVHGEKYDYSEAFYKSTSEKIKIICKIHGAFNQDPHKHMQGRGCPICGKNKNEKLTGIFLREILGDQIEIISSKKFVADKSKVRKNIYVDYYFKVNDQQYIVEYNGKQHYEPRLFKGMSRQDAEECLAIQQKRDEFLRYMCKEYNINLIEIDGRIYKDNKIRLFLQELFK